MPFAFILERGPLNVKAVAEIRIQHRCVLRFHFELPLEHERFQWSSHKMKSG
jgi:hypothetical protein